MDGDNHGATIDVFIIHDTYAVIPAKAGIQQDKNAFCLNPLDSRFRGNEGVVSLSIIACILNGERCNELRKAQ